MPNTPIQYSTALALQGSTNPVATLGQGQTFPVNFTGINDPTTNNPSTFTVGGWIRRLTTSAAGTVFVVNGQLTITMDASGVLTAALGNTQIVSEIPISDVGWHYVAVTYLPSPPSEPNETGVLTLYLDGIEAVVDTVNVTTPGQGSGCFLGPQGAPFEFVSWSIWSQALPSDVIGAPQWGPPEPDKKAANGAVAAFDFAMGAATDISGNHYAVSVAAQNWHTPCMQLNGGDAEVPNVNPGGGSGKPAAFSILGWAYAPNSTMANTPSFLLSAGGEQLKLQLVSGANGTVSAGFVWNQTQFTSTPSAAQWVHCALTWDGNNTVAFYLNGSQLNTQQINPTGFSTQEVIIGNNSPTWYMQGLSIWSTSLSQADIASYMQGADPTGQTGCVANFAFQSNFGDSISGNALTPAFCVITESITPVTAAAPVAAAEVQSPAAPEGPRLLLHQDLIAVAKKNGIDTDTPFSAADMAGPDYAEIANWFDGLTTNLPAKGAARLKDQFLRNVRTGMALRQKGIKTGTFTMAVEGGDTVGYYHTEAGPQEVYRVTGEVMTMQQWAMTIVFDVISLVAAMFGIAAAGAKVTNAVGILEPEITQLITRIQLAYNIADSTVMKAQKVSMAVIGVMYSGNLTYSVIKEIVTGSWWSLAFTIANMVLTLAGLVATSGALIAIKVVQMGVHLGILVHDLLQMPQSEAAAAN